MSLKLFRAGLSNEINVMSHLLHFLSRVHKISHIRLKEFWLTGNLNVFHFDGSHMSFTQVSTIQSANIKAVILNSTVNQSSADILFCYLSVWM